ncbi:MAG: hypothetical protein A2X64_10700 [Ignavibacteria bacterium GWF2_33_9]|nr:MAG: hypothetical protein A2X64_10700 [Ignavibacteria bacterium GWF2_33_9]
MNKRKLKKIKYIYFLYLLLFIVIAIPIYTQQSNKIDNSFYFDAISFRSDSADKSRLDIFLAVPYQSLSFLKVESENFYTKYEIYVTCYDFTGNSVTNKTLEKVVNAPSYLATQGINAESDISVISLDLPEGKYRVNIQVSDLLSSLLYEKSRDFTLINYRKFPFAMSGIMLVSDIFETESKKSITPYLSDNISSFSDGFFVFFETYNQKEGDSVDFVYQVVRDDKVIQTSERHTKFIPSGKTQQYIRIKDLQNLSSGNQFLKVIAMTHSDKKEIDEADYLAITQRTITYLPTLAGSIIDNLDEAVKELRYVATNSQISFIEEGVGKQEKMRRFEDFWESLDPTPNTKRNEAFDDYYSRVEFANLNFKSYAKGWQTDMGMVYIIFGQPTSRERRQDYYNPNRYYERWIYQDNREFIFVDNNGFGDFRLTNTSLVSEKYEYNRY